MNTSSNTEASLPKNEKKKILCRACVNESEGPRGNAIFAVVIICDYLAIHKQKWMYTIRLEQRFTDFLKSVEKHGK